MINFSISALEKTPVRKDGELPGEFLDLAAEDAFAPAGVVEYDLTAALVSGGVLVSGRASARVRAVCGRCLKDIEIPIENPALHIFFEVGENQEILEVDEELRAELLLELPMNPLCDPDCAGLCPICGVDLNRKRCQCTPEDSAAKVSPWSALDELDL